LGSPCHGLFPEGSKDEEGNDFRTPAWKEEGSREKTVLLLDALDEDKEAFGRVAEQAVDLLNATNNFFRVIITCRNQFLPLGDSEIFPRQDRIKIGGFTCPVKYVSPFSDDQVRRYLEKRFPSPWLKRILRKENENITYAEEVINHMGDLRFRPMLLSSVDDLIGESLGNNPYLIYKKLVDKWLDREERIWPSPLTGYRQRGSPSIS